MNSLVFTRWRPDRPDGGAQLRNWQNIRALASLGFVDVVSVGVDDRPERVEGVREWVPFSRAQRSRLDRVRARLWLFRAGAYRTVDAHYFGAVARWLEARRGKYDVAVLESLSMESYLPHAKRAGCRVVFDAHNIEGVLRTAVISAREAHRPSVLQGIKDAVVQRRVEQAERQAVQRADLVWVCSDDDARCLAAVYGAQSPVAVVPNAVDVDAYSVAQRVDAERNWTEQPLTLLFPGSFGYYPNEDAALRLIREVLPAVRKLRSDARLVLLGRDPSPAMIAAARDDGGVEVTGQVDSVVPYLARPCVVTLPITVGSGTRLKILEAFAAGRPVVSTAKGAEGIGGKDGEHMLIRENANDIADGVAALWSRPAFRDRLCANALALVRARYSWQAAAERIAGSLGRSLPLSA